MIFTFKKFRLMGGRARIKKLLYLIEDLIPIFQSPQDLQHLPTYLDYTVQLNGEAGHYQFTGDELQQLAAYQQQISRWIAAESSPSGEIASACACPHLSAVAQAGADRSHSLAMTTERNRSVFSDGEKDQIAKLLLKLRQLLLDKIQAPIRESSLIILDRDATSAEPLTWPREIVVVLDHLRSPFNVGAILRTMECVGLRRIVSVGYTPRLDTRQVQRSAMGCETSMSVDYAPDGVAAVQALQSQGFALYVLETIQPSQSVFQLDAATLLQPQNIAFVVGNEEVGVDEAIIARADQFVHIPTFGKKNSLNVSIAFSIAIYQFWSVLLGGK